MRVITFATQPGGAYGFLQTSMNRLSGEGKHTFLTVGWGQNWCGFGDRIIKYRQALESFEDDDVCLFVDAYDVIFTGDLGKLEQLYLDSNDKRVVFSTELQTSISEIGNLLIMGPPVRSKSQKSPIFICAGVFIGFASSAKALFDAAIATGQCSHRYADDQYIFTSLCRSSPDKYRYDVNSEWFLTWSSYVEQNVGKSVLLYPDGTMSYKGDKKPFVLHRQFAAKLDKTIESLGYSISETERKALERDPQYNWKFLKHHIYHKWYLLTTTFLGSSIMILLILIAVILVFLYTCI